MSRLAHDTAVAAPLKGRSVTNSLSPEATAQTTALESSPINCQKKNVGLENESAPMLIKQLHPGLTASWFTGLVCARRVFWSLNSTLSEIVVIVGTILFLYVLGFEMSLFFIRVPFAIDS